MAEVRAASVEPEGGSVVVNQLGRSRVWIVAAVVVLAVVAGACGGGGGDEAAPATTTAAAAATTEATGTRVLNMPVAKPVIMVVPAPV